jgi:hypothetical protein
MRIRRIVTPKKPVFAIIVEGECEFWYFQMLKRNERSIRVDLKPEIPQRKKLGEQFKRVIEYSKDYDKVFWIVDFDVIISENHAAQSGGKSPQQEFKRYFNKLKNDHKNVVVIINNPCLEFWILLHFEATGKYYNTCAGAVKQLFKYLPDYEKTERYYTKPNHVIYLKLKPVLNNAIDIAKRLAEFDLENPKAGMTQMHFLFEDDAMKEILSMSKYYLRSCLLSTLKTFNPHVALYI